MMVSAKIDIPEDTFLVGLGSSPGIAIGEVYVLNRMRLALAVERQIVPAQVQQEMDAFFEAVRLSKKQLEEVKQGVDDCTLADHLYIIDTHLLILDDQMLLDNTVNTIRNDLISADGALKRTLAKFREIFSRIEDEYLRERVSDIDSVGDRLIRNLMGEVQQSPAKIDRKVILVAHDLSPADTLQMDRSKIMGFVTDVGGRTSHTAILARSLGIPAVVGLEAATSMVSTGLPLIVDGSVGTVILNPSKKTFREYLSKKQVYEYLEKELQSYRELAAETLDGFRISLRGNLELPAEVPLALEQGAEGVGLFRSEFLYMNRSTPPCEEEQLGIYREIAERVAPQPVTIRTLDVGGDKFVPEISLADEANPAMGLRAIRFSLKERELFRVQVRAILRASAFGNVKIMFPMISGVGELRTCKAIVEEIKEELRCSSIPFDEGMQIGIMIETPSAAIIADLLAKESDFFSVGTNDMIQYCLAVDRGNEHVAYLYEPLHPAILRALKMICEAGARQGIEVSMCGEMASEPLYSMVLLGLGFNDLSMNISGISRVKRIVRKVSRADAKALLEELLLLPTATAVISRLDEEMARRFPELFGTPNI